MGPSRVALHQRAAHARWRQRFATGSPEHPHRPGRGGRGAPETGQYRRGAGRGALLDLRSRQRRSPTAPRGQPVQRSYPEGDRGGTPFYVRVALGPATISLHYLWDNALGQEQGIRAVWNRSGALAARPDLARDSFQRSRPGGHAAPADLRADAGMSRCRRAAPLTGGGWSRIAPRGRHARIWVGAEGAEAGNSVRQANHRVRTGLVIAIERGRLGRVEAAGHGVLRVVEPEPHVERVRRGQADVGIKAEDLIEEDRSDLDKPVAASIDFD